MGLTSKQIEKEEAKLQKQIEDLAIKKQEAQARIDEEKRKELEDEFNRQTEEMKDPPLEEVVEEKTSKKSKKKEKKKSKTQELKELVTVTIDTKGEKKEYKFPKHSIFEHCPKEYRVQENKKKISEGEVAVLYMRISGLYELKYVKPDNGMFIVEGRYYHIIDACNGILGKKRIPLAVIPEWSFIPLSKKEYEIKLGSKYQDAQSLIIKSLENAEIVKINQDLKPKAPPNSKLIIGILIAAVAGIYFLNKFFGGG